jgi:hypothetical protein
MEKKWDTVIPADLKRLFVSRTYTWCLTSYRTRHFFNNFTTNENIATKFEAVLHHCVRNVTTTNVLLFKFRCNIFIGVRIIKEMPGSIASGTPCILVCLAGHERVKEPFDIREAKSCSTFMLYLGLCSLRTY